MLTAANGHYGTDFFLPTGVEGCCRYLETHVDAAFMFKDSILAFRATISKYRDSLSYQEFDSFEPLVYLD